MGDRLSALVRGYYEQVCLDVGLHAYQIGHPQQAGGDGRGVLHHECGNYGIGRAAGARRSIQSFYWWHHQTAWEDGKTDLRKCISLEQM